MKKIWDFLKNFVVIAYILLIIFVTICLLSYNNYKVTVFGKNTILPIIDEDLEPKYSVGDLLIITKNNLSTVREGDDIFFYRTIAGETIINYATVKKAERVSDVEVTYTVGQAKKGNTLENEDSTLEIEENGSDYSFSSSYFIGKVDTATTIPKLGSVLGLLESKWGFLFLGVFPSLIAFLYTVRSVIVELQGGEEEEKKTTKKKSKKSKEEKINKDSKDNIDKDKVSDNVEKTEENPKKDKEEKVSTIDKNDDSKSKEEEKVTLPETEKTIEETKEKVDEKLDKTVEMQNEKDDEKEPIENLDKKAKHDEEGPIHTAETKPKLTDEQKKALIEAKMKTMTEEQKRALIEAKLKTMTDEQKRALIEAKRKKMEADKNKD